jgi:hypothetical protein
MKPIASHYNTDNMGKYTLANNKQDKGLTKHKQVLAEPWPGKRLITASS